MCGISGIVGRSPGTDLGDTAELEHAILYRGRDDQGSFGDDGVRLFQARLAIIDPAGGHQPMADAGGEFVIVFSGEIYNYVELRREYEARGARFRTQTDTEVVLEGFRLNGAAVCRDLNGMFAFAVWNTRTRELVLARDRLGKKPLYWHANDDIFAFASTLDAFDGTPGWSRELSPAALALYAGLGSIPRDLTVYRRGHAVPPGCTLTLAAGATPSVQAYWAIDFSRRTPLRLERTLEEYEELLTDAIRLRLRSDVPLALTFSGGVDSGTIAALCAKRLERPLTCFTVDHHTPADPSDEVLQAQAVAAELGLAWEHVPFDYRADLLDDLSQAYAPYDQPCQQMALVYSDRLYRAIRPHATVVLSGNGCDELFTGYTGDEGLRRRELARTALRPLRSILRRVRVHHALRMPLPEATAVSMRDAVDPYLADDVIRAEAHAHVEALAADLARAEPRNLLDVKLWLHLTLGTVDANFRVPDISGLNAQVEVRSPYLDHRMVEFAAGLPARQKVGPLLTIRHPKYVPRRSYARMVPAELAWAPKRGMGANLRWDRSIVEEPRFGHAMREAFDAIDAVGLPSAGFRRARQGYEDDFRASRPSVHAGPMMSGFMLGNWLCRERRTDVVGADRR